MLIKITEECTATSFTSDSGWKRIQLIKYAAFYDARLTASITSTSQVFCRKAAVRLHLITHLAWRLMLIKSDSGHRNAASMQQYNLYGDC